MKRGLVYFIAVFSLLSLSFPVAAAGGEAQGTWGLMFSAQNLLSPNGFKDGYQPGAGIKYWVTPSIAARALVSIDYNEPKGSDISTTLLGFGLAGEWHPKSADVSPYLGPLLGLRTDMMTGQTTTIDLYFGALFGVEFKIIGPLSAFAEYDLVASFDANGTSINLGTDGSGGGKALIGFCVYF
jgi:hypothetical protein